MLKMLPSTAYRVFSVNIARKAKFMLLLLSNNTSERLAAACLKSCRRYEAKRHDRRWMSPNVKETCYITSFGSGTSHMEEKVSSSQCLTLHQDMALRDEKMPLSLDSPPGLSRKPQE